ncbi:MAG: acetylornithine deacetylase [Spongiibacteraceae bacterium]
MTAPAITQMLRELIQLASVSSTIPSLDMGNRPVVEQLANWLQPLGFNCKIMPLEGISNKANLVASYGSGSGGLVLAGHTDTVPFDESRWQSDPFKLTEKDQRLYGLGSCDMKGFFAIAITALETLLDQPFKAPLIILATADEESSMDGARALVKADLQGARYAVVGEPTGMTPIRAHKGMMMEGITIRGRAGHSSNPMLGNSALEAMHELMGELMTLRGELQTQYHHPGFAVPGPSMNFGCIHGGDNPNRICGECELHFDIRPVPGMELDVVRQKIHALVTPIAERRKINIGMRSLMAGIPAYEESDSAELIQTVEKLTGQSAESVGFATEAPFLQKLGLQTVVMGPGSIDQAHQPDEFLALDQIGPSISVLRQLIQRYCL